MKKLAIVSSHNIHCGNATYAEALRKEFSKFYDVTIIPLNVHLLRNKYGSKKNIHALAEKHIDEIALQLREFDYVNLQVEFSLYAAHPYKALSRLKKLLKNSKNVILTFHRVETYKSLIDIKSILNNLSSLKLTSFMKEAAGIIWSYIYYKCTKKLVKFCKSRNVKIIVHTEREKFLLQNIFDFQKVYDHPITFLSQQEIQHYKSKACRSEFKKKYSLPDDAITIGIFGFIAEYKGHLVAIKAMQHLPENYHLLIFGSLHPQLLCLENEMNSYLKELISTASEIKRDCIHFLGKLEDDDFINAILCCDYNILPYYEKGQSGSAVAALSLELSSKSIMSNNDTFKELQKYTKDCFKTFDVGNHYELAEILKNYRDSFADNLKKYVENYNIEKNILLHKQLFEESTSCPRV